MHALLACLALLTPQGSPDFQRVHVKAEPDSNRLAVSLELPKDWLATSEKLPLTDGPFGQGAFQAPIQSHFLTISRSDRPRENDRVTGSAIASIEVGKYKGAIGELQLYPESDSRHRAKYWALFTGPKTNERIYIGMLAHKADLNDADRKLFRRIVESIKPE